MARAIDLDLAFAALADPTRRAMLTALLDGAASVSDLAAPFEMSLAGISKHLRILAEAGLVSQVRVGREKLCRLEPDGLNVAAIWMQGFGGFEGADLEAVERVLTGLLDDEEPGPEEEVDGGAPGSGAPDGAPADPRGGPSQGS